VENPPGKEAFLPTISSMQHHSRLYHRADEGRHF